MGWTLERKATQEDHDRLNATAADFIRRYGELAGWRNPESWIDPDLPNGTLDTARHLVDNLPLEEQAYYRRLLKKRVARALRHPWAEGIAHDHVGWYAE